MMAMEQAVLDVVQDPVDLEMVLKTCLEKDDLHRFLRRVLGNGGIFAPVAIWRKRRKILVPAFSPKILDNFVEIFSDQSEILAARLGECVGRGKVCLWPYISTYTLDAVCDLGSYQNQTFLDHLIRLSGGEKGYNNIELREEVLTLTIAGTDTSAVAIGYTLKLLGMYPKIQEKVVQEMQEVFGDSDRPLVKDDLLKLKYLERVVKESLRLFPPVPFIIRKVLQDIILPSGIVLPAGSGIVVSIWGIHRDPKYWGPDAECFDPDRFAPERFKLLPPCSYMPFSSGPRNCVVKTALSTILRRYKIVAAAESGPIPHIKSKIDIMMKATDDYEVVLEKRD
ncbi:unnamed protein product, partial [Iphiclides podalirius]